MEDIILAGIINGVFIFFKAFQQRNVAFLHYRWVPVISFSMTAAEIYIVSIIAITAVNVENIKDMIPLVLSIGLGGTTGAMSAMWLHSKFIKG